MKAALLSVARGAVAQAYLFTAPVAGAAEEGAEKFLMTLFCESHTACGECLGCRRFLHRDHVDMMEFEGDAKMDDLRRINEFLMKAPYEGGYKAVYIKNADMMRPQPQNFLLKPIEEPMTNTVFVLTATAPERLLATVRSRCQTYAIPRKPKAQVIAELGDNGARAQTAASFSRGYTDEARRIIADEEFWDIHEKAKETAQKLVTVKNPSAFLMTERLMAHKERVDEGVFALLSLFMDAQRVQLGCGAIDNADAAATVEKLAEFYTKKGIWRTRCVINRVYDDLARCKSWNSRMAVQGMVLRILEERAKWHR